MIEQSFHRIMEHLVGRIAREDSRTNWASVYQTNFPEYGGQFGHRSFPELALPEVRFELEKLFAEPHMLDFYPNVKLLPPCDLDDWTLSVYYTDEARQLMMEGL